MTWRERLTPPYPDSEAARERLTDDARCWVTCAVGELRQDLERRGYTFSSPLGMPADAELRTLGDLFATYVRLGAYKAALNICRQIASLPGPGAPTITGGPS